MMGTTIRLDNKQLVFYYSELSISIDICFQPWNTSIKDNFKMKVNLL
jgi:hypothetical protein